jgi:hypothetical protein
MLLLANVVTSTKSSKALDIGGPMTKQGNNVVWMMISCSECFIDKQFQTLNSQILSFNKFLDIKILGFQYVLV